MPRPTWTPPNPGPRGGAMRACAPTLRRPPISRRSATCSTSRATASRTILPSPLHGTRRLLDATTHPFGGCAGRAGGLEWCLAAPDTAAGRRSPALRLAGLLHACRNSRPRPPVRPMVVRAGVVVFVPRRFHGPGASFVGQQAAAPTRSPSSILTGRAAPREPLAANLSYLGNARRVTSTPERDSCGQGGAPWPSQACTNDSEGSSRSLP